MTLVCQCGSPALRITSQSYTEDSAFEAYKCESCGATGSLSYDELTGERLTGCLESGGV